MKSPKEKVAEFEIEEEEISELYESWLNGNRGAVLEHLHNKKPLVAIFIAVTMMELANADGKRHQFAASIRNCIEAQNYYMRPRFVKLASLRQ
jgi:hypothetical protein